jgi:hypothetical protein
MSETKKILISGFILFNLLTMIRIHLPLDQKFFHSLYKPIDPYLSFFSIYQSWTMFSPNPSRTNVYVTADVHFVDGTKDTYTIPRNSELRFAEIYTYGERMRVITEAIRKDTGRFMWKDTAKFALRKVRDKNFHKIPVKVELVRHWNITPDMKSRFLPHLSKINKYQSYKFFTHEVL